MKAEFVVAVGGVSSSSVVVILVVFVFASMMADTVVTKFVTAFAPVEGVVFVFDMSVKFPYVFGLMLTATAGVLGLNRDVAFVVFFILTCSGICALKLGDWVMVLLVVLVLTALFDCMVVCTVALAPPVAMTADVSESTVLVPLVV